LYIIIIIIIIGRQTGQADTHTTYRETERQKAVRQKKPRQCSKPEAQTKGQSSNNNDDDDDDNTI